MVLIIQSTYDMYIMLKMKPKIKIMPSMRITIDTKDAMEIALEKLNEKSVIPITMTEYRRICYLMTSQLIIEGKELPKITQM